MSMSDGTTATTLAPETDEMSKVRDVFERALNAIMEQSKLSGEVAELRKAVQQMQASVEFLQTRNATLDEHIQIARKQRDEAQVKLGVAELELTSTKSSLDMMTGSRDSWVHQATSMEVERDQAFKERDDALMRSMELEEELRTTRSQLDKVREAIGVVTAEPKSIPATPVEQPRTEGGQFGKYEDQAKAEPDTDHSSDMFDPYSSNS